MLDTKISNEKLTEALLASFAGMSSLKREGHLKILEEGARQLATTGRPTSAKSIAQALSLSEEEVNKILQASVDKGFVYFNDDGTISAMWAITILEAAPDAPHRFRLDIPDAPTVAAWCALDTFYFARIFKKTVHVTSHCPVTNQKISLTFDPDGAVKNFEPSSSVVSVLIPDQSITKEIRGNLCHYILFFASEEVASEWAEKQSVTVKLLGIAEAAKWIKEYHKKLFG